VGGSTLVSLSIATLHAIVTFSTVARRVLDDYDRRRYFASAAAAAAAAADAAATAG